MKTCNKNFIIQAFFLYFSSLCCLLTLHAQSTQIAELESKAEINSKQWSKTALTDAVDLFREASSQRIRLKHFQKASNNLLQAGRILIKLGDKTNAKLLFEKSRQLSANSSFYDEQIQSLGELALLELENGNANNCSKYLIESERLLINSSCPQSSAFIFFVSSELDYYQRKIPSVITKLNKAVEILENSEFFEDKAKYLLNLGYAYLAIEDRDNAMASLNQSLKIWNSINNVRGEAFTHIALGFAFANYYEKQKAVDSYKYAEKLFSDGVDLDKKAMLYNGLGRIYMDFGNWQIALDYKKKALDYYEKTNYKFGITATLTSVAILNSLVEPSNESVILKNFDEAYELAKSINDKFYCSVIEEEIGNHYFRNSKFAKALIHYNKAEIYFQNLKEKRETSYIKTKVSQILMHQNQNFSARQNLTETLKLNRLILDKLSESETLYNLAKLGLRENKIDDAKHNIKESINLTEALYSDVANSSLKRSYFSNIYERYELFINLLMQKHKQSPSENFAVQALQASEKSRSRSLLETLRLSEANFTKDANPELVQKEKEIRNLLSLKADKLTELLSSSAEKSEIEKVEDEVRTLENELETIKADLKQQSPVYSAIKNPSAFDVNDFQANVLDDKTLLLEFSFGAEESYLWLVGKNEVSHFTLPKREILDSRIQKLLDLLKARESSEGEEPENYQKRLIDAEKEYESEARLLSNELFGQIADKLDGKRLIIVPDGKLYYFPISALPLPNAADNEPMLLTNEIVYEPSAATLQILGKTARPEKLPKELLVFADPIFSLQDNRLSAENKNPTDENDAAFLGSSLRSFNLTDSNNQLSRLFATQEEAESIVKIVGASNATIVSGFAANRQRVFEKDISDYKIIHFATHGLMNDTRPELSGVVLSLFDENGEAQKGFIRLQDIYSLNLSADLVVLSACQSGIGKEVKGEGLMSLTGGFIQSGANSVLSSLWKVDDYATAELMKNFYQELSTKNLAPSQALRNAQIKMRQNPNFKSPFYWAAFTVQGEFRHPISVNEHRFSYLWILLTAIFVGLLIWFVFRFVKVR